MNDGTRKRRACENATKSRWYAIHRARRFRRRFGWPYEPSPAKVRAICWRDGGRTTPRDTAERD